MLKWMAKHIGLAISEDRAANEKERRREVERSA